MTQEIQAIYGLEPMREGEYPLAYIVNNKAYNFGDVSRIVRRVDNFGDYGVLWFDVFGEDDRLFVSVAGRAIGEVHYKQVSGPLNIQQRTET